MKHAKHASLLAQILKLENLSVIEQFAASHPTPHHPKLQHHWLGIASIAIVTLILVLFGWIAIDLLIG